jgi:hypothetical protein
VRLGFFYPFFVGRRRRTIVLLSFRNFDDSITIAKFTRRSAYGVGMCIFFPMRIFPLFALLDRCSPVRLTILCALCSRCSMTCDLRKPYKVHILYRCTVPTLFVHSYDCV